MYLLYVDESGDTGPDGSEHLLLAGAAIFEGKWRQVRDELEQLLVETFPDAASRPRELHAAEARKGRLQYSQLTGAQRAGLLQRACAIVDRLNEKEVVLFTVVVQKSWWFSRNPGRTGDDLYIEAFEDLVSRFDFYLKRRLADGEPSKGLIIADPRHAAFCRALRAAVIRIQHSGTRWAQLRHVIESVLFLESHESPGVQIADLASYAVWRLVTTDDAVLATLLKHSFDREPMRSAANPGKWHGIRFKGAATAVGRSRMAAVWSTA